MKAADCGPLTCADLRGRPIKVAGHMAAAGLIEQAGAFRGKMEEMKIAE